MAVREGRDRRDDPVHQGWPSVRKGRESRLTTGVQACVSLFLLAGLSLWLVRWRIGAVAALVQPATFTVPEKWGSRSVGQVAVVWATGFDPCLPALVQSAAVAVPEKWDGGQLAEVGGMGFGPCLSAVPGKRVIEANKSVAIKAEHELEYSPYALSLSLCIFLSFSHFLSHHNVVDVGDLMTAFCKMGRSLTSTKKPDELMCLSCLLALCSLKSTPLWLGCFVFSICLFCVVFPLLLSPFVPFSFLRILPNHHDVADISDLMTTFYSVIWSLTSKKPDELLCIPCLLALCSLKSTSSRGLIPSW